MNKLIEELLVKGFTLEVFYSNDDKCIYYTLKGFYKSGSINLKVDGEQLIAYSRYNTVDEINSFDDLVSLNYRWWLTSKERYEGWSTPESKWLPYLKESGRVKETKIEKLIYT